MGYTTTFDGSVTVKPPLNDAEAEYLARFSGTRRMKRHNGPYFADLGSDGCGQDNARDIIDYNDPPDEQPGLWCQWVPTEDHDGIKWDGNEKFYDATEWMVYLIDHFLKPGAEAAVSGDPQFADFTFDHVVNGEIYAEGEESGDLWKIVVADNVVKEKRARITYDD
jgi:hypothetical protein